MCWTNTDISGVKSNLQLAPGYLAMNIVRPRNFKRSDFDDYELFGLSSTNNNRLSYLHIKEIMQIIKENDHLITSLLSSQIEQDGV